jgi:hypothetical protein
MGEEGASFIFGVAICLPEPNALTLNIRQHVPPKRRYQCTILRGVITQESIISATPVLKAWDPHMHITECRGSRNIPKSRSHLTVAGATVQNLVVQDLCVI